MAKEKAPQNRFDKIKAWIIGLTGVLVVVPALLNGGYDIYAAVKRIPRTESEKNNVELFKKYFNKQPVAAFPVPIKQDVGTVQVRFAVYEEGDVYIEFGKHTQWFPFPRPMEARSNLLRVAEAFAQPGGSPSGFGSYLTTDQLVDGIVVRERRWENGVLETLRLDPRTGKILRRETRAETAMPAHPSPAPPRPGPGAGGPASLGVGTLAPIDLQQIGTMRSRTPAPGALPADLRSTCFTASGACEMVTPQPLDSRCECVGPTGTVPGVAR